MTTYRDRAFAVAVGLHGDITTKEAEEVGIPPVELVKIAARGRLRHVARGIYRFEELPPTRYSQYFEAVARVGGDAHLVGDAVLAFHDLALVNPLAIRIGTSKRVRHTLPGWIKVQRSTENLTDLVVLEGIPCSRLATAIRESRPYVMRQRLIDCLPKAVNEGLLDGGEAQRLEAELRMGDFEQTQ